MQVEADWADQNRPANVNKSHAKLAPAVGQCFLPTHTWRKSDCTDNLNAATFIVKSGILSCLPSGVARRAIGGTNGNRCRPRFIPCRTRCSRFSRASFLTLFAVRSADQLRRWRHSPADTFSRIEYS